MSDVFARALAIAQQRSLAAMESVFARLDAQDTSLLAAMRYSCLNGGKRVRPLLVYAAAEACDKAPDVALDTLAIAIEFVHAYSLIHDDLPAMDDDDLRRGQPTCHVAFDEATAILAGDALQTLAFEVIADEDTLDATQQRDALKMLARAAGARGMVMGQAIDLSKVGSAVSLPELEQMHRLKTGALIECATLLGARAANADPDATAALQRYAEAIGLAFQVRDDILDVSGSTQILGKTQGSDESRGKPTYVSLMGLDAAQRYAHSLLDDALDALVDFSAKADTLRALARYIIERDH